MLIKNFLGLKRDLHLCKWPTRTFYSATYFSFTAETIILRIGLYELELSKQIKNKRIL
tara:strand:+ start:194 stop:367 length:174 start_codon:yes stop_codon:yes gene_type:complete